MSGIHLNYRGLVVVAAVGVLAAGLAACSSTPSPSTVREVDQQRLEHAGHGELTGDRDHR